MLTLLLALLWLPVMVHCQLESIPGLGWLSCCGHSDADDSPAHHTQDCEADSCATVESGLYKLEDAPGSLVSPPLDRALPSRLLEHRPENLFLAGGPPIPADFRQCWQFAFRAALEPRAPSFYS